MLVGSFTNVPLYSFCPMDKKLAGPQEPNINAQRRKIPVFLQEIRAIPNLI
jgi:hypothetical protein